MNEIEYILSEIRKNGYLSALKIKLRLSRRNPSISREEAELILSKILSYDDIHKIAYTNSYVSALRLKDLYFFNPELKKRPKRKKKPNIKKKVSKNIK